ATRAPDARRRPRECGRAGRRRPGPRGRSAAGARPRRAKASPTPARASPPTGGTAAASRTRSAPPPGSARGEPRGLAATTAPGRIELQLRIARPPAAVPRPRRRAVVHHVPDAIELAGMVVEAEHRAAERRRGERHAEAEQQHERTHEASIPSFRAALVFPAGYALVTKMSCCRCSKTRGSIPLPMETPWRS